MKKRSADFNAIPGQDHSDDRQFIASLHKGLDVLRNLAHVNRPLGNKELSSLTGFPKATVSRITYTLARLGYLRYLPDNGKYVLGLPVLGLGYACLAGLNFAEAAKPLMQELADHANSMVALGSRDEFSMLYVAESHSRGPVSLQLRAGSRISMVRSAMGRAYLAGLPEPERVPLLAALAQHTGDKWPAHREQIEVAIDGDPAAGLLLQFRRLVPGGEFGRRALRTGGRFAGDGLHLRRAALHHQRKKSADGYRATPRGHGRPAASGLTLQSGRVPQTGTTMAAATRSR